MRRNVIVVLVLFLMFLLGCSQDKGQKVSLEEVETVEEEQGTSEENIFVYVCGAVKQAGVYELPYGSRVYEAIQEAGGFSEDAAVTEMNQAEVLEDEERLYVPTISEVTCKQEEKDGKINLNTASKDELMTLPGVGESKAELIIQYRDEYGRFQSIEDIMNISGIKEGLFEKIKNHIKI